MLVGRRAALAGSRTGPWAGEVMMALVAAYVLALSAQLRVGVSFSPVPVTAQTLVVLLIGALLPRRIGLLSVVAYLMGGTLGLPFFAGGNLAGPTGGYLMGFAASVLTVSTLLPRAKARRRPTCGDRPTGGRVVATLVVLLLGSMVIYALGLPWLAFHVGPRHVVAMGLLPYLLGDALKLGFAASIVSLSR